MSKHSGRDKHPVNSDSPIRRISKDEKAFGADKRSHLRREWPGKKHLASQQATPLPQPGGKNRIHSVLVALPVLMLMIGLFVYFRGESAQNNGAPVIAEMVNREGAFKSVSEVSGIGTPKHYLWYTHNERSRGVRITYQQREQLVGLSSGDALTLELAPRVAGSPTLWAYRVVRHGEVLIDVSAQGAESK